MDGRRDAAPGNTTMQAYPATIPSLAASSPGRWDRPGAEAGTTGGQERPQQMVSPVKYTSVALCCILIARRCPPAGMRATRRLARACGAVPVLASAISSPSHRRCPPVCSSRASRSRGGSGRARRRRAAGSPVPTAPIFSTRPRASHSPRYEDCKRGHLDTAADCARQGFEFNPAVFETTGARAPTISRLLQELARARATRRGETPADVARRQHEALSVSIRRSNARMLLRRLAADGASEEAWRRARAQAAL
eukprot:gene19241-biopygen28147